MYVIILNMSEIQKKKILIVGNSAKEYALGKKLSANAEIFAAPGVPAMSEFASLADIREDKVSELLDFALENAIDLTICSSETAIKSDIAGLFQSNGQMIFAPTARSAHNMINKADCKKFLYKLHIPTAKFGVFDKQQLALDYLKTTRYPLVIRTEENNDSKDRLVCSTTALARTFVDDLILRGEKRIVMEDYVYGHEFSYYVITDGYSALPLSSCANYKFMEDGDGGLLTSGVGAYSPDYNISAEIEDKLMKNVSNILSSLERKGMPYVGILGLDGVIRNDGSYVILELKPFLSDHDCSAVLNLIDDNLTALFEACANGSFADDYEKIKMNNYSSVSCVLHSGKYTDRVIKGLDLLDDCDIAHFNTKMNSEGEYITQGGKSLVVTKTSSTLSRAAKSLYEEIDCISFDGKKYRKDICI